MKITVTTFAAIKEISGFDEKEMEFPDDYSIGQVKKELLKNLKGINLFRHEILLALNEEYCDEETILKDGDCLALFPPVSGG